MLHNLVLDYMSYLSNAQLVLPARRCDIVGKKIFDIGEKYYFEDLGIRHALVGFRATDIDKIGERLYVQVAYKIPNDKVRDREFGNLGLGSILGHFRSRWFLPSMGIRRAG